MSAYTVFYLHENFPNKLTYGKETGGRKKRKKERKKTGQFTITV